MNRTAPAALALLLGLALSGCGSDETSSAPVAGSESATQTAPSESPTATEAEPTESTPAQEDEATATQGAWIDQAAYEADAATFHESGDVVLFFNASWCPTCKATVDSLEAEGTPAGLTVVGVDFDAATDLRQQYGVTVQHTFVQVDEQGNELAKFTGAESGEAIAAQTA
ncbi:MAG: thioredoxin family protein [Candidatus Nanopelagicales bacterium]|nr:thioredoxin family protein [Candidatus Nanopelagicales bacterium]